MGEELRLRLPRCDEDGDPWPDGDGLRARVARTAEAPPARCARHPLLLRTAAGARRPGIRGDLAPVERRTAVTRRVAGRGRQNGRRDPRRLPPHRGATGTTRPAPG